MRYTSKEKIAHALPNIIPESGEKARRMRNNLKKADAAPTFHATVARIYEYFVRRVKIIFDSAASKQASRKRGPFGLPQDSIQEAPVGITAQIRLPQNFSPCAPVD